MTSLTEDIGAVLGGLHRVQISGETDFIASLRIAALALRHRSNKRQEQRIVMFIGSPIKADIKEAERLGTISYFFALECY